MHSQAYQPPGGSSTKPENAISNRSAFACYMIGRSQQRKGYRKPRIPPQMSEQRAAWLIQGFEEATWED